MSIPSRTPPDPWTDLKAFTAARIAIGRAGGSLPTRELLDFALAHAGARDAVHTPLDTAKLAEALHHLPLDILQLTSAADSRQEYLQRPDLGRKLSDPSLRLLQDWSSTHTPSPEIALIVSDGLSARACHEQVPPLLNFLVPLLKSSGFTLSPICIVPFGRVAIEDEVGSLLNAKLALILLGERPGLGSPDSLGAYLIHNPRPNATDADRNCLSNIRPAGLPLDQAAETLLYFIRESLRRQLSGVALKDDRQLTINSSTQKNLKD